MSCKSGTYPGITRRDRPRGHVETVWTIEFSRLNSTLRHEQPVNCRTSKYVQGASETVCPKSLPMYQVKLFSGFRMAISRTVLAELAALRTAPFLPKLQQSTHGCMPGKSVIVIDDAFMFARLPSGHTVRRIWPTIQELVKALKVTSHDRHVVILRRNGRIAVPQSMQAVVAMWWEQIPWHERIPLSSADSRKRIRLFAPSCERMFLASQDGRPPPPALAGVHLEGNGSAMELTASKKLEFGTASGSRRVRAVGDWTKKRTINPALDGLRGSLSCWLGCEEWGPNSR